jgi:ParB family chromosome partitioning protein
MTTTIRRLGRGLGGLLQRTELEPTPGAGPAPAPAALDDPGAPRAAAPAASPPSAPVASASPASADSGSAIRVEDVRPNPYQPRRAFDEAALADLRSSIAEHGVLQPIVVRRSAGGYELVAGERRLRACASLGLPTIPAVVREVDDAGMQTLALVENLQREDLNALEKARALRAMMTEQRLTQEEVSSRIGKDRATVANFLRLLDLPEEVKTLVEQGRLSGSQARAVLLAVGETQRTRLARLAADRDLSVRDVERLARLASPKGSTRARPASNPFVADLEDRLRKALSAKVTIEARRKGGTIHVEYHDAEQLDALLEKMGAL